ncbi:MAG: tetratricopeptide repeat protein [Planctomycetales bacterium]|nr:tetratricopeptide repeat protein [Planctomycetales bacterium]
MSDEIEETNAESTAKSKPARKLQLMTLIKRLALPIGCLGWALLLGQFLMPYLPGADPREPAPVDAETVYANLPPIDDAAVDSEQLNIPAPSTDNRYETAERLATEGDYQRAITIYQQIMADENSPSILLKMAACHEYLGAADIASRQYQAALDKTNSLRVAYLARLGLARILQQQGKHQAARTLLSGLALESDSVFPNTNRANSAVAGEVFHRLAQGLVAESFFTKTNWLDDHSCIWTSGDWDHINVWDILNNTSDPAPMPADIQEVHQLARFGNRPRDVSLSVSIDRINVADAIELLAQTAQIPLQWTEGAREVSQLKAVRITVDDQTMSSILDYLVSSLGLTWYINQNNELILSKWSQVEAQERQRQLLRLAERLLLNTVTRSPEHPGAPSSLLALGCISFNKREYPQASKYFEQVRNEFPLSSVVAAAYFDLGKSEMLQQRYNEAIESFAEATNHGQGRDIEAAASIYIGRIYLDQGEPTEATRPLTQAVRICHDPELIPKAVVTLAAGYILGGNPNAANAVLMEFRDALDDSDQRETAAFVGAFGRFAASVNQERRQQFGRSLFEAANQVDPNAFLGPFGYILLMDALDSIGITGKVIEYNELALRQPLPPETEYQLQWRLANTHLKQQRINDALVVLNALGQQQERWWARRSRLLVAGILVDQKRYSEATDACLKLLQDSDTENEKIQIMRILGQIYEANADHRNASLCYAGMLPGELVATMASLQDQLK